MGGMSLVKLYKKYIRGTAEKSFVIDVTYHFSTLTNIVSTACNFEVYNVYLTTRIMKHLYDAKPAEEFEFVLRHLGEIVKYPDHIYENRNGKRGDLGFVKEIKGVKYFCSIEKVKDVDGNVVGNYVVTAFRLRKESYLKNYRLLWSWKGDLPSS